MIFNLLFSSIFGFWLYLVMAWMLWFIRNCWSKGSQSKMFHPLSITELKVAIGLELSKTHTCTSVKRFKPYKKKVCQLPLSSCLKALWPSFDSKGLLRVGGRWEMSQGISYEAQHPLVLHGKHPSTRLITHTEYIRLLHAAQQTLHSASVATRHHIQSRDIWSFV